MKHEVRVNRGAEASATRGPASSALEAFMFVDEADPDAERESLFKAIVGSCLKAQLTFGEADAAQLWRRVAYYCKDAAESNHHPRLI